MAGTTVAGAVAVEIIGRDANFKATLDRVNRSLDSFWAKTRNTVVALGSLRSAFQTTLAPLTSSFSVFASFEAGMSKVQAITGATAKQIGQLREQAKELGKTTFFTASQVADAQKFLGMAGYNPEKVLAATPKILNLALAGDMDLGMAADIATNIATPFNIAADQIDRINDVLAKAATSSNTNVLEMGQAFKYAAPAAAAAGQSLEECAAAMSILANSGIKADMAGTGIRQMLIKLADSNIQQKLKEQFNIDVQDAAGKMRPLLTILQELKTAVGNLGQTDQMAAFYDIFEARAGTAAITLGNAGDAVTDFRLKMIEAEGTAADMAKTMADNLKGDWIAFMSAVEGVQIAFGDAVNKMSREWLQLGTDLVRGIANFVTQNKDFIATIAQIGTAVGGGTATILALTAAVHSTAYAFNAIKSAIQVFIPLKTAETVAEQTSAAAKAESAASIAASASATVKETAAVMANTAVKKANAVATTVAFNAYKGGAIYGIAGDGARLARDNAKKAIATELMLQQAYRQSAAARIASAASAKTLAVAELSGDVATKTVTAETIKLATIRQAVTLATIRQTVVTRTCTAATNLLSASTKVATGAFLALKVSMMTNPMMWIAGAVAALGGLVYWATIAQEKMAELHDEASKQRENGDKEREIDSKKFKRLEQLAAQQKLSNDEMKEAKKLTEEISGRYGNFGARINEVAGKLNLAADAMKNFNDAMNAKALQDWEAELAEGQKNVEELTKTQEQYYGNSEDHFVKNFFKGFGRDGMLNTGFGFSEKGLIWNTSSMQLQEIDKQVTEQRKKNAEIMKKINAVRSGETALDVAKDEGALLDERIAEGQNKGDDKDKLRELEDAEKGIAKILRNRERENRTSFENEIADLKERNEEYKKYLQLLITAEEAKPENQQNIENIETWYTKLDLADSDLENDMQRVRNKAMFDLRKITLAPMEMSVSEKRDVLDAAIDSGDEAKIKKARAELAEAKKELELTSYKNVQTALNKARAEYRKALDEFNAAEQGSDTQVLLGQQLKEAENKFNDLNNRYENLSETKFNNRIQDQLEYTRLVSGTFNKHDVLGGALSFMAAEKKDMTDIADNTEETVAQLRDLNENIKNGGMVYS